MGPEYIYVILNETDMSGAWDDPRKAVKWYFKNDFIDNGYIEYRNGVYTVDEMVEKMLDPGSDYPVLNKIVVNPDDNDVCDNDVWGIDR